jgi:hypothetical protein
MTEPVWVKSVRAPEPQAATKCHNMRQYAWPATAKASKASIFLAATKPCVTLINTFLLEEDHKL